MRKEVVAHQLARIHRALIEAVAVDGYEKLRVRDVVRRAGVSSRAFYELFGSKDDCFLWSYDRLVRRATRQMVAAQAGEADWRRRTSLIFDEFARQVDLDPQASHMALINIHRAGPLCSNHAERAERGLEMVLGECLARAPRGAIIPPLILEGIVAGIMGIAKDCLSSGQPAALRDSKDELVEWALRYANSSEVELAALDRGSVWRDTALESPPTSPANTRGQRNPSDERTLVLKRTAELAVKNGYSGLTVERIRTEANISRREFLARFDDVADCYTAAFEHRAGEAMAQAARAQAAARTWAGGIYRAIAVYWSQMSKDPFLAQALLVSDFPTGAAGARSRQRIMNAMADQLLEGIPNANRPTTVEQEASLYAVWSLCRTHLLHNGSPRRNLSATLAYLLLTPTMGSRAALSEMVNEQ